MSSLISNPQLIEINLLNSGKKREDRSLLLMLSFSCGEPLRINHLTPVNAEDHRQGGLFGDMFDGNLP